MVVMHKMYYFKHHGSMEGVYDLNTYDIES